MAFKAVRAEGGLLPADLLERIYQGDVDGQRAEDFGIEKGRVVDEAARMWDSARILWSEFRQRCANLPPDDRGTRLTRSGWVEPLLGLLGYTLRYTRQAARVGGTTYPISHRAVFAPDWPDERLEEALPVHIVSIRQALDRRSEGERMSPHSLLQEYLNRSDHVWGLLTNGLVLRVLRESAHLVRPAYVEFDLETMFEGGHFADFVLLYRLVHRSRLPVTAAKPDCWLQRYYQLAQDEGGRIRKLLGNGVQQAIKSLANGLLRHPANEALRGAVTSGSLSAEGFYAQLLRLVYRLLFLMVAEERGLLTDHPIYHRFYGIGRLRDMCERPLPRDSHDDLYRGLKALFEVCRREHLSRQLGIEPLNGHLFDTKPVKDLEAAELQNRDLLEALRHLSRFRDEEGGPLRRVNYAALDVEELGSVYESLLDLRPVLQKSGGSLTFDLAEGTERRSTGSYYTPPELVKELVDHALVPVMRERLEHATTQDERERALLSLRVCDPACGSGHFLLAAARRIARELARVRSGEEEPPPGEFRKALREVIVHCLYGVDRNPMAVELCKVALWIEGHERGKPLTFLDHRILRGDSLVGLVDLKALRTGIPDEAFDRTNSDEKAVSKVLKAKNRRERQLKADQTELPFREELSNLAALLEEFKRIPDDSTRQVAEKAVRYAESRSRGSRWWADVTACHLWTAPFFMHLTSREGVPTTGVVRQAVGEFARVPVQMAHEAWELAETHRFFHWPLEFPDVFASGGFDVILSNPPFMGGLKISEHFGEAYRRYLTAVFARAGGTADLCAYFYRRAFALLQPGGHLGMVATNTIGQGDTREGGLAVILRQGGAITFARRFIKWPGKANVEVNLLAIRKGSWPRPCLLDGKGVEFISSRLDDDPEEQPKRLRQNEGKAFQGSIVLGMGFVLEPEEAQVLIAKDPRNRECLFPYLNGEDLNSDPEQRPSRWVICFFDWPLEKAQEYPDLLRIVEDRVKPERQKLRDDVPVQRKRKELWWIYGSPAAELYQTIATLRRVIVRTRHSEFHMMAFASNGYIYSDALNVFAFDDDYHFSLLQSTVHEAWVWRHASSLESRNRYTPTDCFDTFPFPQDPHPEVQAWVASIGAEYHEHRRQIMRQRDIGFTKTYRLFHDPECQDGDVVRLREFHAEMDRAVLACYGWEDIDLGHGFYPNERGQTRYTIVPSARREILHRLLDLNLRTASSEGTQRPMSKLHREGHEGLLAV